MQLALVVLTCIIEIFTLCIHRIFTNRIMNSRGRSAIIEALSWGAYFLIYNYVTYILSDSAWVNIGAFFISYYILFAFLYEDSVRHRIYMIALLYLTGMCSELITYFISNFVIKFYKQEIFTETTDVLIGSIISKIIWFCMLKFILLFMKKKETARLNLADWLEAICVPIGSSILFIIMFPERMMLPGGNEIDYIPGIAGIMILLAINLSSYYLYEKGKAVVEEELREKALQEQCNYYMRQCEESKKLWMELSKFRHDEKQKNIYVQALLENGNYAELKRYYEERQEFLCMRKRVAESGNIFFDSIINYKAELASHDHIQFLLSMEVPCDSRIDGEEISICLGNLLDNAIEAVREVEETGRQIYIKVKVQGANLYLEVRNPYRAPRIMKGQDYATTKKGGGVHGWGLQIIREIVNRHNGEMEILDDKNEFRVIVLLYQAVK